MRLSEFTQEPPVKAVLRDYIKQGYKRVGEPSASAAVFACPDRKEVIKVGKLSDCWLNFAEVAMNSNNPHVPKIKSIDKYGPHYLAVIEFLKEVPESFMRNITYLRVAAWLLVYAKWKTPRDIYLARFTPGQIKKLANDLEREDQQLADALKMVVGAKGECNFDMHPENLMKRGSTIVISDPLTHQG